MVFWLYSQRVQNAGAMKEERAEEFRKLLALMEELKQEIEIWKIKLFVLFFAVKY